MPQPKKTRRNAKDVKHPTIGRMVEPTVLRAEVHTQRSRSSSRESIPPDRRVKKVDPDTRPARYTWRTGCIAWIN